MDKDKLYRDFMALADDGERGRFLASQLFLHSDARARYAEIKSLEEGEKLFTGKFETLKDMVCERAEMPEFWETFCTNFVRLCNEARAKK